MPTASQLRELEKEKGEYLISYPESWRDEHPGAFPVDAVIVSYEKWEGVPSRRAVDDRQRMNQLFKMLGFRVKILVDKSADELKTDLKLFSSKFLNRDITNCFVCFVSAYGNRDCDGRQFIRDLEGTKIDVMEDIIEPFKRCKALDGKPKVFFINLRICISDKHTLNSIAGEFSTISLNTKGRNQDPCKDFLAVFSSEEENLGGPDLCQKTVFVPALIDTLHQNHNDKDIGEIVNEANLCQTASVQSTLDHKLFWRTPDQFGKRMPLVFQTSDQAPELDIVLFHGYEFGDQVQYPAAALSSWFTKSAIQVCWPVEWLPKELGGIPMRVFCLNYSESTDKPELELEPESESETSKRKLNELAEWVRKDLGTLATKPLIFIAHGLGGLLIQDVLNSKEESVQNLKKWLRGIVFYGVPYDLRSGAKNFSLLALESALKREKGNLSVVGKSEIEEAMNSAGAMQAARQNFCKKYKEITLYFEEGKETYGSKINLVAAQQYATKVNTIVEKCSSCNHFDICRPETLDDSIFTDLLRFIRKQLRGCDRTDIVGQDSHRKKLKSWLLTRETKSASVAGITGGETFGVAGMGGIGKTTLANSLLKDEDIRNYYDHRVYWIPVKRHPNIIACQRRLLKKICKEMPSKELDTEKLLQEELKRKLSKLRRVLLFLDDVWEKNHVDRLLGDSFVKIFPQESKCIITSRKPAELAKLDTDEQIEKLDVLNDDDAKTLFCSKAFLNGQMPLDNSLRVAVEEVIAACGNMPILLATIGADRWGKRSIESWRKVRDRLKHVTAENAGDEESTKYQNLIKQVMISYDDLPESDPASGEGIDFKDYFLDFAAFPEREEIEIAVLMDMWTKPGITEDGAYRILEELEQRCLVKIVGYWCHVHDIFRALALKLVEEQPLNKRKRLFAWELSNSRLPEEWGISQNVRSGDSEDDFETEKMVIAKSEIKAFHPSDAILFRCLTRLRMLFLTSNLNLVSLPPQIGYMKCLEKLDLSWCLGLERLPREIGQLESLEKLNMAGCSSLTEIPAEVGKLNKLLELNMQSCGIVELPVEIGELTSLTYLCLNGCHQLRALPEAIGKLSSLERLECDMLEIMEIPRALGDLSKLKYLSFGACGGFTEIPVEFVNLKNLVYLWFVNSKNLKVVPDELDKLVTEGSLTVFNVYNTSVIWKELPPNLHALPKPFDGTITDDEVDSTADNPDGPYWSHRRGMLVNTTSLYDPSNKEQRRLSFGIVRVVTLAKNEPFMSPRFIMAIRIIYTMGNYMQTRHAIVRCGGVPVLLRCIDKGDPYVCGDYAAATLANMCVTPSTHKAIVDSPHSLDILTRVLHRKNLVSDSAFQALLWISEGDRIEKEFTYSSEILEKCGHTSGHKGCACIWCQHSFRFFKRGSFLEVKNVF